MAMQGFILNLNRVRDEDLLVSILSKDNLETLYRFYGARHGTINIGFKIDYEKESSAKASIARLRDVIHIGYKWLNNYNSLKIWQEFIRLFYKHLKDSEEVDDFYFLLLEEASLKWEKQNPKRVAIESYVKLLRHEGRLHNELECFLCSKKIEDDVSLLRAFLPSHKECSLRSSIPKETFLELMLNSSTLFLENSDIEKLWLVLQEGF